MGKFKKLLLGAETSNGPSFFKKKEVIVDNRSIEEKKKDLAKLYGCSPEEIYIGDIVIDKENKNIFNYKYVEGNITITSNSCSNDEFITIFPNLEKVNDLTINYANTLRFPKLKKVNNLKINYSAYIEMKELEQTNDITIFKSSWVNFDHLKTANIIIVKNSQFVLSNQVVEGKWGMLYKSFRIDILQEPKKMPESYLNRLNL